MTRLFLYFLLVALSPTLILGATRYGMFYFDKGTESEITKQVKHSPTHGPWDGTGDGSNQDAIKHCRENIMDVYERHQNICSHSYSERQQCEKTHFVPLPCPDMYDSSPTNEWKNILKKLEKHYLDIADDNEIVKSTPLEVRFRVLEWSNRVYKARRVLRSYQKEKDKRAQIKNDIFEKISQHPEKVTKLKRLDLLKQLEEAILNFTSRKTKLVNEIKHLVKDAKKSEKDLSEYLETLNSVLSSAKKAISPESADQQLLELIKAKNQASEKQLFLIRDVSNIDSLGVILESKVNIAIEELREIIRPFESALEGKYLVITEHWDNLHHIVRKLTALARERRSTIAAKTKISIERINKRIEILLSVVASAESKQRLKDSEHLRQSNQFLVLCQDKARFLYKLPPNSSHGFPLVLKRYREISSFLEFAKICDHKVQAYLGTGCLHIAKMKEQAKSEVGLIASNLGFHGELFAMIHPQTKDQVEKIKSLVSSDLEHALFLWDQMQSKQYEREKKQ